MRIHAAVNALRRFGRGVTGRGCTGRVTRSGSAARPSFASALPMITRAVAPKRNFAKSSFARAGAAETVRLVAATAAITIEEINLRDMREFPSRCELRDFDFVFCFLLLLLLRSSSEEEEEPESEEEEEPKEKEEEEYQPDNEEDDDSEEYDPKPKRKGRGRKQAKRKRSGDGRGRGRGRRKASSANKSRANASRGRKKTQQRKRKRAPKRVKRGAAERVVDVKKFDVTPFYAEVTAQATALDDLIIKPNS